VSAAVTSETPLSNPPITRRYVAAVEYDGGAISGWQRLSHGDTVQSVVERALSFVVAAPVLVTCAGRTDSGVHGRGQIIHFDIQAERSTRALQMGTTSRLPDAACLLWVQPVGSDFHARYSALARRYRYRILNRRVRPALERQHAAWERAPLDAEAMHRAAQHLVGLHDFSAFRTAACQAKHPLRDLHHIDVRRQGEWVEVAVQANAFLHHMVRNIVGSLLLVGRGEQPEHWLAELLAGRNRHVAGPTAQPQGLVFEGPLYPARFGLPPEFSWVGPEPERTYPPRAGSHDESDVNADDSAAE
jgi:tRNA pseudouridine38-40 synthase